MNPVYRWIVGPVGYVVAMSWAFGLSQAMWPASLAVGLWILLTH